MAQIRSLWICGGVRLRLRAIERSRRVGESGLGNADGMELHYVCIARSAARGFSQQHRGRCGKNNGVMMPTCLDNDLVVQEVSIVFVRWFVVDRGND